LIDIDAANTQSKQSTLIEGAETTESKMPGVGRFLPFRELPVKSENWPVTPQLRADKLTKANSWSFFVPFNH